ncbi:MAG: glutamate--cysteine ligase [Coxiellaceae bacterium]|nr:MAG: glutamate--cysteine ligase [Coxiellaceae bacterium]
MTAEPLIPVPHLATALQGPLLELERQFLANQIAIEAWFREQWRRTPPPIYSSVDLRNAGFKISPVDTNLFPAGFNNLNPDFMPLCIQAMQSTIEQICPEVSQILLIPENHTRNMFYFESVAVLTEILVKAGFAVRIGSLLPDLTEPKEWSLPSGKKILLEPLVRKNNKVGVADFFPCLVLLNNDLSDGVPPILENLSQLIMPSLALGWATRLKSQHFAHYQQVSEEFAARFELDAWQIAPLFDYCDEINFMTREGEACLAAHVDSLLTRIKYKYQQQNIDLPPFVVIKADAGTYGMAVMTVRSVEDVQQLNRKQRTRMATLKGGRSVDRVIIQEGVYTSERHGPTQAVAEPVVYMVGRHVVGGFYRVHQERGDTENLNAPGMYFEQLAFEEACNNPSRELGCEHRANRFYLYGVIARLAAVAAARELQQAGGKLSCR